MSDEKVTRIVRTSTPSSNGTTTTGDNDITNVDVAEPANVDRTHLVSGVSSEGTKSHTEVDDRTKVVSAAGASGAALGSIDQQQSKQGNDPVVGWLVIVDGPGKGCACQIYTGMNSIGRSSSERVALEFGDNTISRDSHAFVVYDNKQKEYYVQHGGKANLVRHNDEPVMSPKNLAHGDRIEIGETTLLFVPLCGENFDWDSSVSQASDE